MNEIQLGKLIDSITEQKQKRCDLEAQLRFLRSTQGYMEDEILSLQRKEELMDRMALDLEKETAVLKVELSTSQSGLQSLVNSRSNLQVTLDSMRAKLSHQKEQNDTNERTIQEMDRSATALKEKNQVLFQALLKSLRDKRTVNLMEMGKTVLLD